MSWKRSTALSLKIAAITLCLCCNAQAAERVIILAPPAADVVLKLGADDSVVGVTNSVSAFPHARKVGTHLSPAIEPMAALKPTLIIASSRFSPDTARRLGAELYVYEPRSLNAIIESVRQLAAHLGKEEEGAALAGTLQSKLDMLVPPKQKPTALYEVRSNPLAMAKNYSVIKDLLEQAGFEYIYKSSAGLISAEYVLSNQPDYYIYQRGPMNRAPEPPLKRHGWQGLRSCIWEVDEFDFARADTQLFDTALELNRILNGAAPCPAGAVFAPRN